MTQYIFLEESEQQQKVLEWKCYKNYEDSIEFNSTQRRKVKSSYLKRISKKCGLVSTCIEQNNNYTYTMSNIQFRSSFNY